MPTNLFGIHDNFSIDGSHVLPALIRKFHDAHSKNSSHVTLWGTGNPRRELMEVEDFARALFLVIEKFDKDETINEKDKDINDFYAKRNKYAVDAMDIKEYNEFISKLSPKELEILNANKQFYEVLIDNIGGLVTPLIFEFTFKDNTEKIIRIPAEVWRLNEKQISKVFIFDKEVTSIRLDPFLETADVNLSNNSWPENKQPSRYQLFKQQGFKGNLMQRQIEVEKLKKD